MSRAIAKAVEDAARKAEQGLAQDFSKSYHDVLKETEQKTRQVATHAAENEAKTAEDLAKAAEHPGADARPPGSGGRGAEPHAGEGGPGDEHPNLGAGEPGGGQGTEGNGGCRTGGDPVDVVSGQMIASETDVDLPGLLPLVLRRAYASGYRGGTLFGPGWSSSLAQRVQIDREGIHYAGDDGQILHYPVPTQPGQQVLPQDGARWPLTWDARTDTIRVESPDSGWTRHFGPVRAEDATVTTPRPGVRPITLLSNRAGHQVSYHYDETGAPHEVRHSGGYRVAVDTVLVGGRTRVEGLRLLDGTDGGVGTALRGFGYDALGRLTDVVNSSGIPLVYGYDDADRITSWTDRNGYWYAYEYGADGRVVRGHGRDGVLTATFSYDSAARVTTVTDSLGRATEFHYDEHHHITAVVDPLGHTVRTEHDRHGRLLSLEDELGRVTRHRYDSRGDLVRVDHPDGTWTTAEYGDLGLPARITTPDGQVWRQTHDAAGNRTEAVDPTGAVTRFRYDEAGRLTAVVDPVGGTTSVRCNAPGLPVQVRDPLGATTEWIRDAFGLPVAVTDPHGNVRRFRWSAEGRLLARTAPDGTTEQWTHDPEGNVLTYVDQLGSVTTMTYGAFGTPLSRSAADGGTVTFTHDTELRVVRVTNPAGLTWDYGYDEAGRTVGETDFDGVLVRYTHDAAGQLVSRATAGPADTTWSTVEFAYDLVGNLTRKSTDGASFSYGYDPLGRLVSATGPDCRLDRVLDPLGRVTRETVNGRTTVLDHDLLGRRTYRRTPSGAETLWTYDGAGNPATLDTSGHTVAFAHDALGRETGREIADGLVLSSEWDQLDRLSRRTLRSTRAAAPLHSSAYTYRADGHPVTLESHDRGTRSFELDLLGRITAVRGVDTAVGAGAGAGAGAGVGAAPGAAAAEPRVLESYAYDSAGSLVQRTGRIGFGQDSRGRTVERRTRTLSGRVDTWRYVWDAEDRLVEAITPGGTRWRYRYDPLGRRIAKERLSHDGESVVEWTEFTWDGSLLVEQTAHGPALPGPYTLTWDHRGLHPVAQTERIELPSGEVDQRFFAVVTDLIGAPTQLVDTEGTTAWQARTTVWGADRGSASGATTTPLRFPGQYHDPETRLHYNLYRYYDPSVGRYLSGDPLGLAPGPNPYAYVDNPLVWADPLGLSAFTPLNLGTSRFWSPVDYRGQRVYQRDDLMNPGYVSPRDKYGRSNLKRMTQGLAPMGPDDKPVNLHHMLQTQDGPIAEVTQSMHLAQGDYKDSGSYNTLHWKAGTKIPSGIDRGAFDDWKSDYWKDRARGLSGGGCGT